MSGQEGPFGREFDSLADIVSFGLAPALLLSKAVLFNLPDPSIGWGIAALYLLCAGLRLARFNCMAAAPKKDGQTSDFIGLPVPMAAGAIVSTMYLIIYLDKSQVDLGYWCYPLAAIMVGISILMMSRVMYPSFKHINFNTKGTMTALAVITFAVIALLYFPWVMPAVIFCIYLLYGLVRPWIAKRWQALLEARGFRDDE
jgi:CDP-diacylglycerol--serine O-phosphatidyltransferase